MAICFISAACTSSQPSYPNAGLRVYSEGSEITNSKLLQQSYSACSSPARLELVQPRRMLGLAGPGLNLSIEWEPVYRLTGDQYDFVISYNKTISKRRIIYRGRPIVLTEDPFRVVVDNVYSKKSDGEQAVTPNGP